MKALSYTLSKEQMEQGEDMDKYKSADTISKVRCEALEYVNEIYSI